MQVHVHKYHSLTCMLLGVQVHLSKLCVCLLRMLKHVEHIYKHVLHTTAQTRSPKAKEKITWQEKGHATISIWSICGWKNKFKTTQASKTFIINHRIYIYNDGFEYIMYQRTWAQRIDGLRRVKSFAHRLCVPRIWTTEIIICTSEYVGHLH